MSFIDLMSTERKHFNQLYGVTIGIITNNQDPEKLGRVKVKLPTRFGDEETDWARIVMPMAGDDRGTFFLPEVDDEVLVMFREGSMREVYILGSLWNANAKPPADNADGDNLIKMIRTKGGHEIEFDDTKEEGTITIKSKKAGKVFIDDKNSVVEVIAHGGTNKMTLNGEKGEITIKCTSKLTLQCGENKLVIDGNGGSIQLKSTTSLAVESVNVDVKGSGAVNVKGEGAANITGKVVKIN